MDSLSFDLKNKIVLQMPDNQKKPNLLKGRFYSTEQSRVFNY